MSRCILPPRLKEGARVALIAPAGPVTEARIRTGLSRARRLALEPVLGESVRHADGYLAGTDAARAQDLQSAIDAEDIDAIWALRGGYGTMRLFSRVDFTPMKRRPKAFIGFSDNTAIHLALDRAGLVSFHGPHAGFEHFPPLAEECFLRVLRDPAPAGVLTPSTESPAVTLRGGSAEGRLAGGNLSLLSASCGTPSALRSAGRILVMEDVDEPVYHIDRMLTQLSLAGSLDGVAGLALGRFTRIRGELPERPLLRVIHEWAAELDVPAVLGLPIGHVGENWTLPLGVRARLDADAGTLEVLDPAVS